MIFSIIIEIHIFSIFYIFIFAFLGSFILACVGFITGLWAEKFDHTATITNFVIQPLSFLSGVFYSIDRLPSFFQSVSHVNPFFFMIDGFRYGFLGISDGSVNFGLIYLLIIAIFVWFIAFYLYKMDNGISSTPQRRQSRQSREGSGACAIPVALVPTREYFLRKINVEKLIVATR